MPSVHNEVCVFSSTHPVCVLREGACKKSHVLKLNTTGKFALNIVDNLVVVHHQSSQVSSNV